MRRSLSSSSNGALSGYIYAALAAILWSLIGPFSKGAFAAGVPPLETAFWRALLGGVCFAGHSWFLGGLRIPLSHAVLFFLFGAWGIGVLFGALQVAIQLSGAAMAMVLMYTAPAWVAVASRIWFHEKVSGRKMAAIAIALTGAALICVSGGSLPEQYSIVGITCGLLSGVAYASHFPFYSWWKKRYSTGIIYTYMLFGGAVFLLPFISATPVPSPEGWGNLLVLGLLTNYAAYVALGRGLQRISQVQVAVIGNIEPALATLWVWLFFCETFNLYGWFGCTLVILSVFLLTIRQHK